MFAAGGFACIYFWGKVVTDTTTQPPGVTPSGYGTLVLTRNLREEIVIVLPDGREVAVNVLRIDTGPRFRMAVHAPKDIVVHRREVLEAIQAQGA